MARMRALDSDSRRSQHLYRQICLANKVLDLCKIHDLMASHVILRAEEEPDDDNRQALKDWETKKSTVLEVLVLKGVAICDLIDEHKTNTPVTSDKDIPVPSVDDTGAAGTTPTISDADHVYRDICKLVDDPYGYEVHKFTERHALLHGHYGRALKLYSKQFDSLVCDKQQVYRKMIEVFKSLKWTHAENQFNRNYFAMFPNDYRLF
ncbi:unnamed protein product [Oppiella nova]|uniref:Uncharacterized protein n=1 Tax=Oppiella nova TaxID=334625 RepID=A0A7R9QW92_9ACAR|nr:unnamed protein product [Oppiella nova]CAG2177912.1 unnamed protein product [Oppiella nova]